MSPEGTIISRQIAVFFMGRSQISQTKSSVNFIFGNTVYLYSRIVVEKARSIVTKFLKIALHCSYAPLISFAQRTFLHAADVASLSYICFQSRNVSSDDHSDDRQLPFLLHTSVKSFQVLTLANISYNNKNVYCISGNIAI